MPVQVSTSTSCSCWFGENGGQSFCTGMKVNPDWTLFVRRLLRIENFDLLSTYFRPIFGRYCRSNLVGWCAAQKKFWRRRPRTHVFFLTSRSSAAGAHTQHSTAQHRTQHTARAWSSKQTFMIDDSSSFSPQKLPTQLVRHQGHSLSYPTVVISDLL
jgi:hypothetical protein